MPEATRARLGNLVLAGLVGLLVGTVSQTLMLSERIARLEVSVEWIRTAVARLESAKP